MERRRRRKVAPRFYMVVTVTVAAAFVAVALLLIGLIRHNESRLIAMRKEQQTVIDAVHSLDSQIEYAQTDDYVQDAARDFGMIKPGEVRYEPEGN